ncbi:MAG: xanthine/uracil/vitamin C permease [Alphaproteobacteria bacterium]|nr:xanthine/uracil/vitamin C permease [Alphaproteobacteria bacterium]
MTRPEDLLYAVDDMPPWPRLLFLGMQHAMLLSVNLVLIVIVFRRAGAGDAVTLSALSLGMIALAISTVLQSLPRGPIGSGYLAPPIFSAIYIGPAVLAVGAGGLPAVFGMTMFAGLVEIGLSRLLRRLRALFPPAISGFIVVIVGLQLGVIGTGDLLGVEHVHRPAFHYHLMVGGVTLATMCALSVWGRGIVRLICSMLGVIIGMLLSVAAGLVPTDAVRSFLDAPIVALPQPHYLAYDFQFRLIPAFLMAGTAAMLRTVGVITTCQKINDLDWKRPELKSIQAGIIADGIGCVIGGLVGVIGMNSAVGPVGVAKAAGATSRYIGFSCAAILVIFALIPKYGALFLIMPQPVIGALMVFTASFMIAGGIQIIVSRSIDSRATYVVGVSLLLGLSREIFPAYFERAVPLVHQFTGSMMSIGVLSAFLLNLIFRIGATRTATFEFENSDTPTAELERLLRARGRAWSVPADVVDRAVASTGQVMQHLADADLIIGSPSVTMTFNDFDLRVSVRYQGALLSLPNVGVRKHFFLDEESFSYGLADFLTGVYPDRMEARSAGQNAHIRLIFSG